MHKFKRINMLLFIFVVLFALVSSTFSAEKKQVKINALVISSRNYASMQPHIYYAFMDSAKKINPKLTMKFVLFNPFFKDLSEEGPKFKQDLTMFMDLLNECVPEIVAIKKSNPKKDNILKSIHDYIKNNPKSYLAKLHRECYRLMKDFDFLIIESSDTYGVHPIYYIPNVTQVDTDDGANAKDIVEALYGFFLVDAAFGQNKPVWGTCHGAQLGYVHAGGRLSRLFDYKDGGHNLDFKRNLKESDKVEDWHIDKWLYTHKKDTPYREYGTVICPAPGALKSGSQKSEKLYLNKDFEHSLAMTLPAPEDIEVISYHPLSEYQKKKLGKEFRKYNKDFSKVLKDQAFIDAYKYNTMLGTQYHPQYTYADVDTYLIFEYLIKKAIERKGVNLDELSSDVPQELSSLSPPVYEFKLLIESDPKLYMLFTQMFEQANEASSQDPDYPPWAKQAKNYNEMLVLIDKAIRTAPCFDDFGEVAFPVNDILIGVMNTPAGQVAFLDERVNRQLKKILDQWAVFLSSPDSRYVLNDNPKTGWFGKTAKKAMPNFVKEFVCNPKAPHYGFKSWDDFFTRKLRKGVRPIADPDDYNVIVSACEAAPYRIAENVKLRDTFWIKRQPYSLEYMFDGDPVVKDFVGGTIYQGYLSALCYHRWHTPVSGKIINAKVIDQAYYAACPGIEFDSFSPVGSQGYLATVATRALILIEADNPDIGLMAILFVGMGDVSSNEITVYEGQHVVKGDEIGMFHFGGSSYCMIFRPEVKLEFDLHGQTPGLKSKNIPVNAKIATVVKE